MLTCRGVPAYYNHGINGMKRAQNQLGRDFTRIVQDYASPAFGFASRNYYAQFLAAREIAGNPMRHFPEESRYAETKESQKMDLGGTTAFSTLSVAAAEK